ncbi:STAS domain-containing protein [Kitasatospora camelliae]|uniref:STAS domain-containing protein n=1 Tax=Kitasatospora camelliae TaxID=3156397 RepID=A0AAU8K6X9_9ACTN
MAVSTGGDSGLPGAAAAAVPPAVRTLAEGVLSLRLAAGRSVTLLLVTGTLDARCAPELPEALVAAAGDGPGGGLALDLRGVEACDTAGVAALGRACEHARKEGYAIGLAASTADLDRLMVLTDSLHLVADHLDAGPDPVEQSPA